MSMSMPEELFSSNQLGTEVYQRMFSFLDDLGDVEVRVTKSQIAFRRRRGFAYLWDPGRYLDTLSLIHI